MEIKTPIKAIRAKCLECCCGQYAEVKACAITDCSLHPYRMGHRPKQEPGEATSTAIDFEGLEIDTEELKATFNELEQELANLDFDIDLNIEED